MKKIVIYDPAMCCSTGVCGASVDKELLRVATVIENLCRAGADITRFNLAGAPDAFVANQTVNTYLKQNGPEILPITIVDGEVVKTKTYPSTQEFSAWTGIDFGIKPEKCNCNCEGGCC